MWQDYTNAVLGLCVLALSFFGAVDATYAWIFGLLGAIIFSVGVWGGIDEPAYKDRTV